MLLIILWESLGIKGDDLVSLNRCRIVWGLLFLSDIVGANGRHVEAHKLAPPLLQLPESKFKFAEERPTEKDWETWQAFWTRYTTEGLIVPTPLGGWLEPTHRQVKWFVNESTGTLEELVKEGLLEYKLVDTTRRTQAGCTIFSLHPPSLACQLASPAQ